ncbi:MAG TPA: TonB-dependent receptor [Acidobacteriaceae bacterium]|nr:TonB-dependent receptor [Acidobacteriaceae bacterium]
MVNQYQKADKRTAWWVLLLLAIFAFCSGVGAYAQSDNGSIVGTVTDPTGAAIPNATIDVTNQGTGLRFHTSSNGAGEFQIFAVPRGSYRAEVKSSGFQSQVTSFTVQVATAQTLVFKLNPGAVSTTVTVTSAAPLVDTTDATIGETIQGAQITQLPLNGRNFTGLALLVPGVTRGDYGDEASGVSGNAETFRNSESGGAALSINGLRPQADNFLLDGLDDNDSLLNTILIFPDIDATQEFKLDTSVAPAQYGRAGGAIVASSIKSGTNQYHGSAFWFYRSGKFDANPDYRFLGASPTPNPEFNRNQPGFSIGGPFLRNKLFGFGDYQAFRENLPQNSYFVTVPTALMRQGNFSELLATSPNFDTANGPAVDNEYTEPYCLIHAGVPSSSFVKNGQLYDPITCAPIPGNVIAGNVPENAAAVKYFNAYPTPTRAGVVNNFLTHKQEYVHYNTFDMRLDWDATPKDVAFFRVSYDNSNFTETPELGTLPSGFGTGSSYAHARAWGLGYTHTFTPSLVNELLIGYNRDDYGYQPPFYGVPLSADLGIVNANRNQETSGGALIGGNNGIDYTGDYGLYAVPQNTYEVNDSVDWERGHNSLKFGATGILRNMEYFRPISGKGYFNFGNGDFTGFPTAEMLIGFTDSYSIGSQNGFFSNISWEDGFYGQDEWRVDPQLTLQLGLRYDIITWPYETQNRQASFDVDPSSSTYGQVLLAGQNGVSRTIMNNNYDDLAPRVGFAYDVRGNGKEVVRGGYGIFYFPDYGGISNQLGQQIPFGGSVSYGANIGYCVTFTGQTAAPGSAYGCSGSAQQTTPLPAPGFPNFSPAAPPAGLSTLAVNRSNKNQQIQEWNLQVDQQLSKYDVIDVAYVGTKSDHLSTYWPYNIYQFGTGVQNFPTFGGITYENYDGTGNYNGLQLQYQHRQGNNLVVTGSYAWSHALDDSPGSAEGSTAPLYYNPQSNYGNSLDDQRQVFSSSILYNLPFGRGQRFLGGASYPVNLVLGGWQVNVIGRIATGTPIDLAVNNGNADSDRPDLVGSVTYPKSISATWFSTTAFAAPPTVRANGQNVFTRIGTLGRDQIYGPGERSADFSLQKDIQFSDRYVLQLHGDAFNVTNTPQFTNPDGNIFDANFGKVTGTQLDSQREIQLAARFTF